MSERAAGPGGAEEEGQPLGHLHSPTTREPRGPCPGSRGDAARPRPLCTPLEARPATTARTGHGPSQALFFFRLVSVLSSRGCCPERDQPAQGSGLAVRLRERALPWRGCGPTAGSPGLLSRRSDPAARAPRSSTAAEGRGGGPRTAGATRPVAEAARPPACPQGEMSQAAPPGPPRAAGPPPSAPPWSRRSRRGAGAITRMRPRAPHGARASRASPPRERAAGQPSRPAQPPWLQVAPASGARMRRALRVALSPPRRSEARMRQVAWPPSPELGRPARRSAAAAAGFSLMSDRSGVHSPTRPRPQIVFSRGAAQRAPPRRCPSPPCPGGSARPPRRATPGGAARASSGC